MFITVVHKDSMDKPIAWLNVFENADTDKKIEGDRILEFTTEEDLLKTPYLFIKNTYRVIADGQIYTPVVVARRATANKTYIEVECEHTSYSLNDKTFELFEIEGNVQEIMGAALEGTGFIFEGTDILLDEVKKLKIPFTNARYLVNRAAREFGAKIVYDNNKISMYKSFSNATGIRLSVDDHLDNITRTVNNKEETAINYEIDVSTAKIEALEHLELGDMVVVVDKQEGSEKDRVIVEVRKNLLTDKVSDLVLGDPNPTYSDIILDVVTKPILEKAAELDSEIVVEVIHQQVINVETAHILNAWIKNLFVEYVETNMDARINRNAVDRHFIRIRDETEEMVHQMLDITQVEDLVIPHPHTGVPINVYYTAIGDQSDAYSYFTITNPKVIHDDLTDKEVEAFKVKVSKVNKEAIKYKKEFRTITLDNGTTTVTPCEVWGAGTDATGLSDRGKTLVFKGQYGYEIRQIYEDSEDFLGFRLNGATKEFETHENVTKGWEKASFGGGDDFRSLIFYDDGFIVNQKAKFKWVEQGLQLENGVIIPIRTVSGGVGF